jgi:sulfide:quinone oxidoreductase
MGKIAASNIAADILGGGEMTGQTLHDMPALCILDAGDNGVIMLANKLCGLHYQGEKEEGMGACDHDRKGVMIPGPWAHWGKVLFERYFLWKMKNGKVSWP